MEASRTRRIRTSEQDAATPLPTLREFYSGRNVFITGATGFLGKVLIEKLLRTVPDIGTIYLLIRRSRKQADVHRRMLDEIVSSQVFDRVRDRNPHFVAKLRAVAGDVGDAGLGLAAEDRDELQEKVSIVIHGAATVKFHEQFQVALNINVDGVRRIIELCRGCRNLVSLVHVSTAYVNATRIGSNAPKARDRRGSRNDSSSSGDRGGVGDGSIPETIDPIGFDHRALQAKIIAMDAKDVERKTADILRENGNWPNTYTLTKRIGELVIVEEGQGLPTIIVRPTIVTCAEKDPFPGWLDTLIGPGGLVLATALGLLHVMPGNPQNIVDLIPVDYVINCIISCAWYSAHFEAERSRAGIPDVVHIGSTDTHPTTWGMPLDVMRGYFDRHPSKRQVAAIHFRWVQSQFMYEILHRIYHLAPAMIMDAKSRLIPTGKPTNYVQQLTRLSGIVDTLLFFTTNQWRFSTANADHIMSTMHPADRQDLSFDPSEIIWDAYYEIFGHGLKRYILKEQEKRQVARAKL